jgi:hypothetical protein
MRSDGIWSHLITESDRMMHTIAEIAQQAEVSQEDVSRYLAITMGDDPQLQEKLEQLLVDVLMRTPAYKALRGEDMGQKSEEVPPTEEVTS